MKIRVTEQSGIPLKRHLQRSNPFKSEKCERRDCLVCTSGGKGTCYATGVTYEIVCKECSCKYVGETARSAYSRGLEHLKASKTEQEQAVMWKHAQEKHRGKIPTYVMNVTGIFGDDAMLRQITESVLIRNTPGEKLMNTKNEWNYVSYPQAQIVVD